jgi:hypothetical protein
MRCATEGARCLFPPVSHYIAAGKGKLVVRRDAKPRASQGEAARLQKGGFCCADSISSFVRRTKLYVVKASSRVPHTPRSNVHRNGDDL